MPRDPPAARIPSTASVARCGLGRSLRPFVTHLQRLQDRRGGMVPAPPQSQWLRRRHRNPTRPTTNTLAIMVHPWPLVPSRRLLAVGVSVVVLVSAVARAETPPVAAVNAADGFALKGYDAVAYFTTGEPTPGVDEYTHRWKGVTYRFASAENRDRFRADPERYVPQYGGYCAYGMFIDRTPARCL